MAKGIFYRVGQAAKELGTSGYKIRKLAEAGVIADAEWNGTQWSIPAAAVERMKKEGLPPIPRFIDVDNEAASPATNQKERTSTLLAEPSAEMVAAAEEAEISGAES